MTDDFLKGSLALIALLCLGAASASHVRDVGAGDPRQGALNEGALTIRIDPGAPSMPMISSTTATRLGLRPGMFDIDYQVGPHIVHGRTAVVRLTLPDGTRLRRRVAWTSEPYSTADDVVIGPGGVPERVVTFVLRPPSRGERVLSLPLEDQGGVAGRWAEQFGTVKVGGQPLRVRFDPSQSRTLATAGAAMRILEQNGGSTVGSLRSSVVAFGVRRPVRAVSLDHAFAVGPLTLTCFDVRTEDFGSFDPSADGNHDPDEILVVARKREDRSRDRLSIGADYLSRCSSIVFDKFARTVTLSCA